MIEIFAIKDNSVGMSFDFLPKFIWENIGGEGYYTLLAIDKAESDGGQDEFCGIAQFYVDMDESGEFYAGLDYIYVDGRHRRKNVGLRLFNKMEEILTSQKVELITTGIPIGDDGEILSDISEDEILAFLKECGFITTEKRLFKMTRR